MYRGFDSLLYLTCVKHDTEKIPFFGPVKPLMSNQHFRAQLNFSEQREGGGLKINLQFEGQLGVIICHNGLPAGSVQI